MNTRVPTLQEVLYPRCFAANPKRARATRTVVQRDSEDWENADRASSGKWWSESSSAKAPYSRSTGEG